MEIDALLTLVYRLNGDSMTHDANVELCSQGCILEPLLFMLYVNDISNSSLCWDNSASVPTCFNPISQLLSAYLARVAPVSLIYGQLFGVKT